MRILLVVLLSICLSGCCPYHYTRRAGIAGTVIDAHTEKPLSRASVAIASNAFEQKKSAVVTQVSASGAFCIPPLKQWGIFIVPEDFASTNDTVSFRCPGYISTYEKVFVNCGGDGMKRIGVIALVAEK